MISILPEAEKVIRDYLNDLSCDEVRAKLNEGYFGSCGSPKYKFVLRYLKEEDRKAAQERLVIAGVKLQAEANEFACKANKKADKANFMAVISMVLAVVSIVVSVLMSKA